MKRYKYLACGGSFDHFHKGHEQFLKHALTLSETVLIGLTSDTYIKEIKGGQHSEPYTLRYENLLSFLRKTTKRRDAYEVVKIDSVYIPKQYQSYPIDALFVTEDSKKGAALINAKRLEEHLSLLPLIVHPFTKSDDGGIISSQRIRDGEITREGRLTIPEELHRTTLFLPTELRKEIAKPFGVVVQSIPKADVEGKLLITVGDVVTKYIQEQGFKQQLAVVDLKVQRKVAHKAITEHMQKDHEVLRVHNAPGTLQKEVFSLISSIFKTNIHTKRVLLHVIGEEDLVALPCMLRAPLESILLYGQPNSGMVKVVVTEEVKERIIVLLRSFKKSL